jgi:hypothetical protein
LIGFWIIPATVGSGCRADQHPTTNDASSQTAYLAVMKRQIYPALVVVDVIRADGNHVRIEYVPPDIELTRVLEGQIDNTSNLFEQLETEGFFDWPDSALVPPPAMDVDSDPVVIVLDTGGKNRRMFTREPHIHPAIQTLLDTLDSAVGGMKESGPCLVCIPRLLRVPEPDLYEIKDTSEAWVRSLIKLSIGPFPIIVPPGEAKTTALAHHREFSIEATQGTYRVKCLNWP